ncbi:MAG TPA: ABC transporter permease [Actinomycetota bacterium]|jgi:ABC-2 type transport system permease protein|nr:ABC transporter permease [Actinomycetota bacterium]
MRAALVIAFKDLRQRLRDRSALIVAFVAPLALALIITSAFGGGFSDEFDATYAVLDQDLSELSTAFTKQVLRAPQLKEQITVVQTRSVREARELIRRNELSAVFVIPKEFSESVLANRRATISVLRNPEQEVGSEVAVALATAYTGQINAGRLSVLTTIRAHGGAVDAEAAAELARAAARERIPVELVDGRIGVRKVSGASYFGPAMAIFFLFFTTSFASRSLLAERELGTMTRVLASPIRRSSVILGKALAGFAVGVSTLAVMFVVFGVALGISWGDPVAIGILSIATVLAVMGVTSIVQSLAKTQQQADAYSTVVSMTFALVGGSFFPLSQMPAVAQRLSYIAPNAWALRGFSDIIYDGAHLSDLGVHLTVILAFAAVAAVGAAVRSRNMSFR